MRVIQQKMETALKNDQKEMKTKVTASQEEIKAAISSIRSELEETCHPSINGHGASTSRMQM
jgi:hypothetical protein